MSIAESIVREIERAIEAAEFPSGMSVHDGKARVDSSHLRRLLAELAALRAEVERRHGIGGELIIARRERDEARAELAALRAERDRDGELLDWLERNPRHESAPYFDDDADAWGFPYEVSNAGGHGGGIGFHRFDSLRAAIDAAMRAER